MPINQTERPKFYEEQYLGAADLTAAVEYARLQQARHTLGAHTWGIAMGLQLVEKPSPSGGGQIDVFVQPGYAWDGFGRPITVLAPYKVPAELFKAILFDAMHDNGKPAGRLFEVWLRYDEQTARPPRPGFVGCAQEQQFSRVQEQFRLEIGARSPDQQRDNIAVAGRAVDAQQAEQMLNPHTPPVEIFDASIPYQQFPAAEERRRWLIPLGSLRWQPHTDATQLGRFVQRDEPDKAKSESQRRYIGVVAGAVHAAGANIRLCDRTKAYSHVYSDDLVWVEGKLRVDGDVRLFGGQLDFRNVPGQDLELRIRRQGSDQAGARALQVAIGPTGQNTNRFAVGTLQPLDPATGEQAMDEKFIVLSNGNVGIGTTTPRNRLGVRAGGPSEELLSFEDPNGTTKWHINQNLGGNNPGLNFVETNVADGRLFIQAGGNAGIGTTSPSGRLTIHGTMQPQQGELTFFPPNADIAYDGGSDGLFILNNTHAGGGKTAFVGGDIGIGLVDPICRLHVANSINADAKNINAHVAVLENTNDGDNAAVLALKIGKTRPTSNFITFFGGNNIDRGRIQGDLFGITLVSGAADFAECLPLLRVDEVIEAGDIVGVFDGKITKVTEGAHHVTAISARPIVVGNAPLREDAHLYGKAAFMGQVPVKVRGLVRAGDYIIPSGSNDGTGIAVSPKALSPVQGMQAVGKAWESADGEGFNLINVAVGLPSSVPGEALISLMHAQQTEITTLKGELRRLTDTLHQAPSTIG